VVQAFIRPYRAEDRPAVRRIAYDTALIGNSIADQYRDFDSLADMLSAYYTDHEPHNALVAERDGQVVGYLLSCLDTQRAITPARYALRHMLLRGVCFRPGTARFYARAARDTLADLTHTGRPRFDLARYPSHTHSNFAAHARGRGLGMQLYLKVFDHLKAQGSPGMHGEVLVENPLMIRWLQDKLGYQLLGQPYHVPGLRGPDGKRLRLQMLTRDLLGWRSGV